MKYIFLIASLLVTQVGSAQSELTLEERISKLEEKVEEHEIDKAYDRLHLSGTFINYLEHLDVRSENKTTQNKFDDHGQIMSMHVALNFDLNINQNIDFYSTVAMGKIWNNDGRDGESQKTYRSYQGSYGYNGSEARFDVAYMRWKSSSEALSFGLGRMTTRGGPPMNQLDALSRNGTYPRFGYNAIFDGAAVVYDFKSFLPQDLSYKTRLFYTPAFFISDTDRSARAEDADNNKIKRRSDQITWLNELEITMLSLAKKISLYSMLWYYDDFYDSAYQSSSRDGVEYYRALSHTLFLGFEQIAGSGVNFSWSNLRVNSKSDGFSVNRSDAHLFNLNYAFESGKILGVEQIFTDRSYYIDDWSYLQFNDFYQRSASQGQHFFLALPFESRQVLRLGLYNSRAEANPFAGKESKQRTQNYYASYRIDF